MIFNKGKHGQEPGPEGIIYQYEWNAQNAPISINNFVTVNSKSFTVNQAFGQWAWENASKDPLTSNDKENINKLIENLHKAISSKDISSVISLLKLKNAELAKALDVPLDRIEAGMQNHLSSLTAANDWNIKPFNANQLVLHPYANNRIVQISGPLGNTPIQGEGLGRPYTLDIMVSKVANVWTVVR